MCYRGGGSAGGQIEQSPHVSEQSPSARMPKWRSWHMAELSRCLEHVLRCDGEPGDGSRSEHWLEQAGGGGGAGGVCRAVWMSLQISQAELAGCSPHHGALYTELFRLIRLASHEMHLWRGSQPVPIPREGAWEKSTCRAVVWLAKWQVRLLSLTGHQTAMKEGMAAPCCRPRRRRVPRRVSLASG